MPYKQKSDEQFCIIGGSGRIGNKVMLMLMKHGVSKLCLVPTQYTVNKVKEAVERDTQLDYRLALNDKIFSYNQSREESEQKVFIPENIPVYLDVI